MNSSEVILISDKSITLPVFPAQVQTPADAGATNSRSAVAVIAAANSKAKANSLSAVLPATFSGKLNIVAIEKSLAIERDMFITVTSDTGVVAMVSPGSVKLPMLCALEKDLAIEFTLSFISRLAVEMKSADDPNPIIKVQDGIMGGDKDVDIGHFFE